MEPWQKAREYTPEFKAKAVRLLTESRSSYSSETNAIAAVAKDPGIAPESLRRWRDKADATVAAETRQSAEDAMDELKRPRRENAGLRRTNEILTTASAPNRLHVADITYVRMADGRFGYTAFVTDAFARRIVGWACATSMDTEELPLQSLEQATARAAAHGGADGLVHHSD